MTAHTALPSNNLIFEMPRHSSQRLMLLLQEAFAAAQSADFERAITLTSGLLQDQRVRPEDRARLYRHLVQCSAALDNPAQARFYASQGVRELKKTLGATHELTLFLRSSELFWMCESGMADIAHRRFPDLIRDVESHLSSDHELRWAVLMNATVPLKQEGDFLQAIHRYEQILRAMRQNPPADPLLSLLAHDNYAELLATAGLYERSLAQYAAVIDETIEAFGPQDPRTLKLRNRIAGVLFDAGEDDKAWEQWEALLPEFDEVLGITHLESARLRTLLLLHCIECGDDDTALRHAQTLLDHPHTTTDDMEQATLRAIIADLQGKGGEAEETDDDLEAVYAPGESFFSPEYCPCALCSGEEELPMDIAG